MCWFLWKYLVINCVITLKLKLEWTHSWFLLRKRLFYKTENFTSGRWVLLGSHVKLWLNLYSDKNVKLGAHLGVEIRWAELGKTFTADQTLKWKAGMVFWSIICLKSNLVSEKHLCVVTLYATPSEIFFHAKTYWKRGCEKHALWNVLSQLRQTGMRPGAVLGVAPLL